MPYSLEGKKKKKSSMKSRIFGSLPQRPLTEPMEGEKKRKRADNAEVNGSDRGKKDAELAGVVEVEAETEAEAQDVVPPQPSEEEVEEFFTILRRMHVAVKYFEKTGANIHDINGDGRKITALEKTEIKGAKVSEKKGGAAKDGGLDLNTMPEAES